LERDTAGAVQFALRWVFDTRLEAEMGGNTVSAVRVENRIERMTSCGWDRFMLSD